MQFYMFLFFLALSSSLFEELKKELRDTENKLKLNESKFIDSIWTKTQTFNN